MDIRQQTIVKQICVSCHLQHDCIFLGKVPLNPVIQLIVRDLLRTENDFTLRVYAHCYEILLMDIQANKTFRIFFHFNTSVWIERDQVR